MTDEVRSVVNGPVFWIICIFAIGTVCAQALLIYRATLGYSKKCNILTDTEVKAALKSGAITTIGPAVSVFILGLSMIQLIGAPFSLMRIGMIGAAQSEMTAASLGTAVDGVILGKNQLTMSALTLATLSCATLSLGYLIFVPLMTRGLGKGVERILNEQVMGDGSHKKKFSTVFFGYVFPFLFLGMLVMTQVASGMDYVIAMIGSLIVMLICQQVVNKKNVQWLREWEMGIAVLAGMLVGVIAHGMI